jgi:hypothetical protein
MWNHATGKIEAKQSRTLRAPPAAFFNRFPGRNHRRSADTLPGSVRQAPEAAVGLDRTPGPTLGSMIICLVPMFTMWLQRFVSLATSRCTDQVCRACAGNETAPSTARCYWLMKSAMDAKPSAVGSQVSAFGLWRIRTTFLPEMLIRIRFGRHSSHTPGAGDQSGTSGGAVRAA